MSAWRMPRRMPTSPVAIPDWVRTFDPEAWRDDQADAHYLVGLLEHGLVGQYEVARDWHAKNRHCQAVNAWYRQHPEADNRLFDLLDQRRLRLGKAPSGTRPRRPS